MRNYCVYRHTAPDGRIYIGITSQTPPSKRWCAGNGYKYNQYFTRAIKKYGWENFKHDILCKNLTEQEAKAEEIRLISEYKSNNRKFGFNYSTGGESKAGTTISDKQKELISKANKGKIVSLETREKLRKATQNIWKNPDHIKHMREINLGENNPVYGRHLTDDEKIKRKAKQIIQYDMNGIEIGHFISLRSANEKTGVNRGTISKCCQGLYKQAGGYIWKYA